MSLLWHLVATFAVLSILSIGGANATIPEIHRQVVELHHWMDDDTFARLVAIGQTAPGPNVLVVSMIGWHLAGFAGMLAVTFAIAGPSSLVALGVGRLLERHRDRAGIAEARRALAPIAIGFMLASGVVMTRAAFLGVASLAITALAAALLYGTRLSPLWSIAGGAAAGIVGHHLHVLG